MATDLAAFPSDRVAANNYHAPAPWTRASGAPRPATGLFRAADRRSERASRPFHRSPSEQFRFAAIGVFVLAFIICSRAQDFQFTFDPNGNLLTESPAI